MASSLRHARHHRFSSLRTAISSRLPKTVIRRRRSENGGSGRGGRTENSNKIEFPRIRSDNPFKILGVQKTATYTEVKQRFLDLALSHHPDRSFGSNDGENEKKSADFIRFRQAFEMLKEDMDGSARQREQGESTWTDEEFKAWYYEETGHADLEFRMDMKTRKEVIDTFKQQAQGGLDRGGMWEMARRMAEEDDFLKKQKSKTNRSVALEDSGASVNSSSVQRRRRKRK